MPTIPGQTITTYHRPPARMSYQTNVPRRRRYKLTKYKKKYKRNILNTYVSPYKRLSGYSGMPTARMSRCFDGAVALLNVANQTQPGFWTNNLTVQFTEVPGYSTLSDIYRFFKINSVTIQYTPATRSDEYQKLFTLPTSATPSQIWTEKAGTLEMKSLTYQGYRGVPSTWNECLNLSGKIRKCASTKSFRRKLYPKMHQIIEDTVGTDPNRVIPSPWLSTDVTSNLSLVHYLGIDCYHTLNNISYDNDSVGLKIQRRYVVDISFKGLKI